MKALFEVVDSGFHLMTPRLLDSRWTSRGRGLVVGGIEAVDECFLEVKYWFEVRLRTYEESSCFSLGSYSRIVYRTSLAAPA
mmetsp:Transcript_13228/g.33545  ORF Transcript_13228/g.33545 Transcript_13228/m.33545 type:complete len:82 (-) Transcript_13228:37-282(-)